MTYSRFLAAIVILSTALAPAAIGGDIIVIPDRQSAGEVCDGCSVSYWSFMIRDDSAAIAWSCKPFSSGGSNRPRANVSVGLELIEKQGPVRCSVPGAADRTDVRFGDERAIVSALLRGTGKGKFRLTVEVSDEFASAGVYSTTVHQTVTSR